MELIEKAAEAIESAEALVIGAGAGMGVDSGLPDFRGDQGFWRAYPPYEKLGLSFVAMANPDWFSHDPRLGWGFYGHRLNLYRTIVPHDGFRILKKWGERLPLGYFVFTSNVDGQFQRAGFPSVPVIHSTLPLDFPSRIGPLLFKFLVRLVGIGYAWVIVGKVSGIEVEPIHKLALVKCILIGIAGS